MRRLASWADRVINLKTIGIVLASVAIVIGVVGFQMRDAPPSLLTWFLEGYGANLVTELGSIALTVIIIDGLNARRARKQEKRRLIMQMASVNNGSALDAVRLLELEGWLTDGSLAHQDFSGADLQNANLSGAVLTSAKFRGARLTSANFEKALLDEIDLAKADLTEARFNDTSMVGANLFSARVDRTNLSYANLSNAVLRNAHMQNADLSNATLTGAALDNADLSSADLTGAQVSEQQLQSARSLYGAKLPASALEV